MFSDCNLSVIESFIGCKKGLGSLSPAGNSPKGVGEDDSLLVSFTVPLEDVRAASGKISSVEASAPVFRTDLNLDTFFGFTLFVKVAWLSPRLEFVVCSTMERETGGASGALVAWKDGFVLDNGNLGAGAISSSAANETFFRLLT